MSHNLVERIRMSPQRTALWCIALMGASVQLANAQCSTVLTNIAPDGSGNVHAWAVLTDNYTNTGSGCAPSQWLTLGFTHTYNAKVTITSPSGRKSTSTGSGTQRGGSGTGSIRSDDYLPVAGEVGNFLASGDETITCSIAGLFFTGIVTGTFTPPPPVITGVGDNTTGKNTIYVDTSGYLAVYGSALTAWSETPTPTVTGDDSALPLSFYWASDVQVNVHYSVGTGARTGQHSLWITTEAGKSNAGTYSVYDANPILNSISPNTFQAGNTYTGVVISGSHLGTVCPSVTISGAGNSAFSPTSCSDMSVSGTVTIDPNADPNAPANASATVTLSDNGYGQGFAQQPSGGSRTGALGVTVTPPPPPTVSVTVNGQAVGANSTVYITPTPSLPLLASLVPGRAGVNLTGNATWEMDINYVGPGSYDYGCTLTATTAANSNWNIGAQFAGKFCGGSAVVRGTYQGYTPYLSFTILGQNPSAATVKSTLGTSPWFIQQLANSESPGYLQFQSNGQPVFGAPNGFGIMMIDYHNDVYDLWTWTENVSEGVSRNSANGTSATSFWNTQVASWQSYNSSHPTAQVPMHTNVTETPCVFSYTPSGGQHMFSDAIWIKMYNSGASRYFIQFSSNAWVVDNSNIYNFDYVGRVCSTSP